MGQKTLQVVRRFVGCLDVNRPVAVDPHDGRLRLQIPRVLARSAKLVLEHMRRAREYGLDIFIALAVRVGPLHVRMRELRGRLAEVAIARALGVDDRRVGCQCGERIQNRGKLVILDVDETRRFFGGFARFSGDGGDPIADHDHLLISEDGMVEQHTARALPRSDVGRGKHREHARYRFGRRRVDANDLGVRVRTRGKCRPQHIVAREVGSVLHLAADFLAAIETKFVLAEERLRSMPSTRRRHHGALPQAAPPLPGGVQRARGSGSCSRPDR